MDTRKFTTERLSEERVIIWEIKNFTELHATKSPKNETTILQFTAGQSLNKSSTWKLELMFTKENDIGLFLSLENSYESGKNIHARYSASIKGPSCKLMLSYSTDMREYKRSNNDDWGWNKFVTLNKLKTNEALINDTLTIQVKLMIYGDENVKETTPAPPSCTQKMLKENSLNLMSNHVEELLKTGEYYDFVIRVKEFDSNEYFEKKVHRLVLSSQSDVFEAMMRSAMSEKETGVVTIEDLTPQGLDIMLQFMYTGNLPDAWKLVPEEIANAAEKYNLPLLKTFCDEHLHTLCTPENVFTLLNLTKTLKLTTASTNISEYVKSNLENVLETI